MTLCGGDFGRVDLSEVALETSILDRWVIFKFSILPTDDRFLRMTESMKELLFHMYLNTPVTESEVQQLKQNMKEVKIIEADTTTLKVAKRHGIDLGAALDVIKEKAHG